MTCGGAGAAAQLPVGEGFALGLLGLVGVDDL
jgi:hypothetical protein